MRIFATPHPSRELPFGLDEIYLWARTAVFVLVVLARLRSSLLLLLYRGWQNFLMKSSIRPRQEYFNQTLIVPTWNPTWKIENANSYYILLSTSNRINQIFFPRFRPESRQLQTATRIHATFTNISLSLFLS